MSGIYEWALIAKAVLSCDARGCGARWESLSYWISIHSPAEDAAAPALRNGWRVFAGRRQQYTYCPDHGPSVPMRLTYGGTR